MRRGGRSSLFTSAWPVSVLTRLRRAVLDAGGAGSDSKAHTMATLWHRSHKAHALWWLLPVSWGDAVTSSLPPIDCAASPWHGIAALCGPSLAPCDADAVHCPTAILICISLVAKPRSGSKASKINKTNRRKTMDLSMAGDDGGACRTE